MPQETSDVVVQIRNNDMPEETRSIQSEQSMICSYDGGSINYPYRTLLKDTSFPRCHLMADPFSEAEAFNRSLSMLGHGSPLWEPIGDIDRPKMHLQSGVSIGDVGFLTTTGAFETYFNIFLSAEHPAQQYCPPDLIPLDPPLDSELSVNPMQFPPGTTLVSKGIQASTLSSSPLDIQFTVSAREGGILVLPDGASREDLLSTTLIRDYVKIHALNWYVYFKELLNGMVVHPNGTLYVVTGVDKASTWANCVTHTRKSRVNRLWKSSTIIYRGTKEDSVHHWESDWKTDEKLVYQRSRQIEHVGKCALFVRGMRIAVNIRDWTEHLLEYKLPDGAPFSVIRTVPSLGFRAKIQILKECRAGYTQIFPSEGGLGIRVVFHPMDAILRLLMEESPSSTIAYVEDNVWCSVADKSDADFATIVRLLIKILETHETLVEDGIVTLRAKVPTSQAPAPLPSFRLRPVAYVEDKYRRWKYRSEVFTRLSKVFPGQGVPVNLLESPRKAS